jgi:hypothetical protein
MFTALFLARPGLVAGSLALVAWFIGIGCLVHWHWRQLFGTIDLDVVPVDVSCGSSYVIKIIEYERSESSC